MPSASKRKRSGDDSVDDEIAILRREQQQLSKLIRPQHGTTIDLTLEDEPEPPVFIKGEMVDLTDD